MNAAERKAQAESTRFNAFWPCVLVFTLLACEHAIGLLGLVQQHQQLQQTRALQEQNMTFLRNAQQMSGAIQSLSLDLLSVAQTNAVAKQIVQDFAISWTPGTNTASATAPAAAPAAAANK